eukprot:1368468-Prymnesium_polylepis.2
MPLEEVCTRAAARGDPAERDMRALVRANQRGFAWDDGNAAPEAVRANVVSEFALSQLNTPPAQDTAVVGRELALTAAQDTTVAQTAPGTAGASATAEMELERLRRAFEQQALEKAALEARVKELEQTPSSLHGGESGLMLPPRTPSNAVQAPGAPPVLASRASSIASDAETMHRKQLEVERVAQDARIAALEYEVQRLRKQHTPQTQEQLPAPAVQCAISPLQQPNFDGADHSQVRFPA